jgi:hypothetical protein
MTRSADLIAFHDDLAAWLDRLLAETARGETGGQEA